MLSASVAESMQQFTKDVSVLVCTRNRGERVVPTIESLLLNNHPSYEIVVLDQSESDETQNAITPLLSDSRLRYVRSGSRGLGRAHNAGVAETRGALILITDDDCEVPSDWVRLMQQAFDVQTNAGMIFCLVKAGEYDEAQGSIPVFLAERDYAITDVKALLRRGIGLGAGMGIRRSTFDRLGGFDPELGPGGTFPSGEESDFAYRALTYGIHVCVTVKTHVIHHGFRTWKQLTNHTKRDVTGTGAMLGKLARHGNRQFIAVLMYIIRKWLRQSADNLLHLKKPRGLRRTAWLIKGFLYGWSSPVNIDTLTFRLSEEQSRRLRTHFVQVDV